MHLATALAIRHATPLDVEFVFVSADNELNDAARAENFTVIDPTR
jgi:hypothetical protein